MAFSLYQRVNRKGQTAQARKLGEFPIPGIGEVNVRKLQLKNTRHTPTFENSLLSMPTLDQEQYFREWGGGRITMRSPVTKKIVLSVSMKGKMYEIDVPTMKSMKVNNTAFVTKC